MILTIVVGLPAVSSGQTRMNAMDVAATAAGPLSDRARVRLTPTEDAISKSATHLTTQSAAARKNPAMKWGIAIGIATGAALAAGAANRYGDNEGGQFCGGCFGQWSLISVPAGAGLGAAVGYLIDRARR